MTRYSRFYQSDASRRKNLSVKLQFAIVSTISKCVAFYRFSLGEKESLTRNYIQLRRLQPRNHYDRMRHREESWICRRKGISERTWNYFVGMLLIWRKFRTFFYQICVMRLLNFVCYI